MRSFDLRRITALVALLALLVALPMQASMSLRTNGNAMAAAGESQMEDPVPSSCDGCVDSRKAMAGMGCMAHCAGGFLALPAATQDPDVVGRAVPAGISPRTGSGIRIAPEPLPPRSFSQA